ncbi:MULTISPECIES: hypothetical protein [unclassified Endozoicomonas]|uniref:hypothetical protein n=1 Tax=unclassified Endozoicomonas TaxID=2644528 RepID=UPI0021496099|nr:MULTISPECIES: hypothetical protein [unclassified Endozoicomonas]
MPGRTSGVDAQTTPPVDSVHPKHEVNKSGRLGARNVTGTQGQSLVGRRDSEGSGPAPESIHSRSASVTYYDQEDLPEPKEEELEYSLSSGEASEMLRSLEASRKSPTTSPSESYGLHGAHSTLDPDEDEGAPLQSEPRQPSPGEEVDVHAPGTEDGLNTSTASSHSSKARVSVSSSADPDAQSRKEAFKNELQPKLGFLDKHKKEATVTTVGGILVGVGAVATIAFPPLGICLYACGIMMLSMGLTEIMAPSGDVQQNLPQPKPDKPEPKPDESKSKSDESNVDDGKFMAVRKPVLEALTQGDGVISVREESSLDEDEAKERLKRFAQEDKLIAGPEALLEQMSSGIQTGMPLSEVVSEAIAGVLSRDKSFDPHDAEFKAVTNAILSAAEAMMNATSASEREQALAAFLTKLKEMLPRMSDASLDQLIAMTRGAMASPGTEEAREILSSVLKLLEAEKAERLLKHQYPVAFGDSAEVSDLVPGPPVALKSGKSPRTPPQSSTSETGVSEAVDPSISKNLVHFRVLSFELSTLDKADRLDGSDKNDFLKAAKEVLERPRGKKITGAQFLDELERYTRDKFANVIEKMRKKDYFK